MDDGFDELRLKFRYGFASKHRPYRRNLVERLSRIYKNWASPSKVFKYGQFNDRTFAAWLPVDVNTGMARAPNTATFENALSFGGFQAKTWAARSASQG